MNRAAMVVLVLLVPPLAQAAQRRPPDARHSAAATFQAWDENGDGQLSPTEFGAGWEQAQGVARTQAALARQFAAVDANHDRAIDAGEYAKLVLVREAGKAAPALARFDADADGRLAFAEYLRLVEALAPQRAAGRDAGK